MNARGTEARLVQTSGFGGAGALQLTNVSVAFVSPTSALAGRPAADGFHFSTTVLDGGHPYWWHIYRWNTADPDRWLLNPVPGASNAPPDRRLAVQNGSVPAQLTFTGYADRRPLCRP
jgi:hypothetical protein